MREKLRNYRMMLKELFTLEMRIRELKIAITSPVSTRLTGMPACPDLSPDRLGEVIAKLEYMQNEYNAMWDKLVDEKVEIERAIAPLEPVDRMILRARYFDGLSWIQAAQRLCYSEDRIKHRHGEAMKKLANVHK